MMGYNPVKYVVEFRNADHAVSAADIVKALEHVTESSLRVTVTPLQDGVAHGTAGPAKGEVTASELKLIKMYSYDEVVAVLKWFAEEADPHPARTIAAAIGIDADVVDPEGKGK